MSAHRTRRRHHGLTLAQLGIPVPRVPRTPAKATDPDTAVLGPFLARVTAPQPS